MLSIAGDDIIADAIAAYSSFFIDADKPMELSPQSQNGNYKATNYSSMRGV